MSISTLSFFRYEGLRNRTWAFGMMQFAHSYLSKTEGLKFYRLMGSGRGRGFNPFPDWGVYALLCVWENEAAAEQFHATSELKKKYRDRTSEIWTIYLQHLGAKGKWEGRNPFGERNPLLADAEGQPLAVITRATIRASRLVDFWKYVPQSEQQLAGNEGLIFTKGIGEVPVVQMATFSIWRDRKSLMEFAYRGKNHRTAIKMTRDLDWYKEEMFARFRPYRSDGTWEGRDPLAGLLPEENRPGNGP